VHCLVSLQTAHGCTWVQTAHGCKQQHVLLHRHTSAAGLEQAAACSLCLQAGLTKLLLSGARPSNDQIWSLLLFHLTRLQHLDLVNCSCFSSRSVSSLLQLKSLTSLDIRGTKANDAAAVEHLAGLSSCRRLALSVHVASSRDAYNCSRLLLQQQQQQQLQEQLEQEQSDVAATASTSPSSSRHHQALHSVFPDQQQQQQDNLTSQLSGAAACTAAGASSSMMRSDLEDYRYLTVLGRCQSLRQVKLEGAGTAVAQYCRALLPPWIDVR